MTDKNDDDGLDDLADKLAVLRSPWDHVYHSETGALAALFPKVPHYAQGSPEQLALENEWEAKAVAMMEKQRTVVPKAKPVENVLSKITRGD